MMVLQQESKDAILQAMGDEFSRAIIFSTTSQSKSIFDISRDTGIPLSTCYRRVHDLVSSRLLKVEHIIITAPGKKYEMYRSTIKDARVNLSSDDLAVEVTLIPKLPEGSEQDLLSLDKQSVPNHDARIFSISSKENQRPQGKGKNDSFGAQSSREYRPCLQCERHPNYPSTPPMTLHEKGACLICKSKESPCELDIVPLLIADR
jgi:hypothetical protein